MRRSYKKCLSLVLVSMLMMSMFLYLPQPRAEAITVDQLQTAVNVLTKLSLLSQQQAQQAVTIAQDVINKAGTSWLTSPEINNLKALGLTKAEVSAALNAASTSINDNSQWNLMKNGDYTTVATLLNNVKTSIGSDTVSQLEAKGITVESLILATLEAVIVQMYDWNNIPQSAINTIFDQNSPVQRATAEQYGLNWTNVNTIIGNLNDTQKTQLQSIIITIGSSSDAQQQVAAAKVALVYFIDTQAFSNLPLVTSISGITGVVISWASSDPSVIDTNGKVTRPSESKTVTLTATISKGFISDTRQFTVTVQPFAADVPTEQITQNANTAATLSGLNDSAAIVSTMDTLVAQITSQTTTNISVDAKLELVTNTIDTVFEALSAKMQASVVSESTVATQVNQLLQNVVNNVVASATTANVAKAANVVANILDTVVSKMSASTITGDLKTNLNSAIENVMAKVNTVPVSSGQVVTDISTNVSQVVENYNLLGARAGANKDQLTSIEKKVKIDIPQSNDTEVTLSAAVISQLTTSTCDVQIKNADGASVRLPAQVLQNVVGANNLKLKITKDTTSTPPSTVQNAGDVFDLTLRKGADQTIVSSFGGTNLPVTLPYTGSGSTLKVYYYNEATGAWELLTGQVTRVGNTVSFDTPHFTKFMVAEAASTPSGGGGGGSPPPDSKAVEKTILSERTTIVEIPGKVKVEVPAGVVKSSIASIVIEPMSDSKAEGAGLALLSPVMDVKLQNGSLSGKINITLYFDKNKLGKDQEPVAYYNSGSQWTRVDGNVDYDKQTVTLNVDHLTLFAVFAAKKEAPKQTVSFNDLQDHWAQGTINKLAGMGAISGYPDGTFKPENKITRAEVTAILVKALNLKPEADNFFKFTDDANIPAWAKQSVLAAVTEGIVKGYPQPDGTITFEADKPVTRAELAAMTAYIITKKFGPIAPATISFSDKDNIPAWAQGAVGTVLSKGVVTGYPDNTFKAENPITRAEAASIILRLIELK